MYGFESFATQFLVEIRTAVKQLANKKASGPDGLPHEFFKEYWDFLEHDILKLFNEFWNHKLNLLQINKENIVMIPKKGNSVRVGDFRPISIINIITKVLSNHLRLVLPDLVSCYQTAFTRDQCSNI